jgi:hypothetical protein
MDRRSLLRAIIIIPWLSVISYARVRGAKEPHFTHKPDDLIMDQSGSFGDGAFVIGALSCRDATETARRVARLRTESHFRCTLSHTSRNKWKAQYARKLIDLWIDSPDIKIDLLVLRDGNTLQKVKPIEKLSYYTELVSRLIDTSPSIKGRKRRLIAQPHFKRDRQVKFEKMLSMRNARIETIIHVSDPKSDLLQLVDLVAGATQASQTTTRVPVTNSMKRDVIRYLMLRLGVTSFEKKLQHPRCSIAFV